MNYPTAIVIVAALIAGAIFFSNQNGLDAAGNGEWTGIGVSEAGDTAWAIDTATGLTKYCEFAFERQNIWCSWERR